MKTIKMSIDPLIKEHKELVKILRTGSESKRQKEAKEQAKELKQYKRAK